MSTTLFSNEQKYLFEGTLKKIPISSSSSPLPEKFIVPPQQSSNTLMKLSKVQANLLRDYCTDEDFKDFSELLQSTKAVVAGGSVLKCFIKNPLPNPWDINPKNPWDRTDFDIYVPEENASELIKHLERFFSFCLNKGHVQRASYDGSFLQKNKIVSRVHGFSDRLISSIDIMSVKTGVSLDWVCSNFDFTFCQVWFDGKEVRATHPNDIYSMSGSLNPEYLQAFRDRNQFTLARIRKYKERGFKIINPIPTYL
jgi:hypothetical protein